MAFAPILHFPSTAYRGLYCPGCPPAAQPQEMAHHAPSPHTAIPFLPFAQFKYTLLSTLFMEH